MEALNHLYHWLPVIRKIHDLDKTMSIVGSTALFLHGVILPRPVGDIDIKIVNPSPALKEYLASLSPFALEAEKYPDNTEAVLTFVSRGARLNILIYKEVPAENHIESTEPRPTLLSWVDPNDGRAYTVQNVLTTIEAKARYNRSKDQLDLAQMKCINFNTPMQYA